MADSSADWGSFKTVHDAQVDAMIGELDGIPSSMLGVFKLGLRRPIPTSIGVVPTDRLSEPEPVDSNITSQLEEVSVVGLRFVVRPSIPICRRLAWIALLLVGIGVTIYQIEDRVVYYIKSPTNTNIGVVHVDLMRFPTTTICNENRYQKNLANELGITEELLKIFPPVPNSGFIPSTNATIGFSTTADSDWSRQYFRGSQAARNDTIIECSFNGGKCGPSSFDTTPTDIGYCLRFNSASSNISSSQPGALLGLRLTLSVQQEEYLIASSYSAGFRVMLEDKDEIPTMTNSGIKISPGFVTAVTVNAIYSIELPSPYGECNGAANYTQSVCLAQCLGNYVIDRCKCKDIYMLGDVPVCGPNDLSGCLFPAFNTFHTTNEASNCNCSRQCRKLQYSYVVSQALFSDHAIRYTQSVLLPNVSADEIKSNFAILEVFFSELEYTYIESTAAYSLMSLLCDVGGALGLVLGSTMLTIVELIDVAAAAILWRMSRMKNANNNIMGVEQNR